MNKAEKGYEIFRALKRIGRANHKILQKEFEKFDITVPQGMVIQTLHQNGQMKMSELSKKLSLSNSTVSGIVDRLEKKNIVERIRSEKDRRVVNLQLVDEFEKNTKKKLNQMGNKINQMLEMATEDEYNKILDGFNTLMEVMDRSKHFNEEENIDNEKTC